MDIDDRRSHFRSLHDGGTFLIPNPHDVGTCRLLTTLGFSALATTSGGYAASLGRMDMTGRRSELIEHTRVLAASTSLPLSVDAEQCFPLEDGGVRATVELLARAGASGCSIEDWNSQAGRIDELDTAVDRVGIAAAEAERQGMVLTARAENHLRGVDDLDDTVSRLIAYRKAGAHVVYAPGLPDIDAIGRIVTESGAPVNVLLQPGGPSVGQLEQVGVRRVSVGSSLARIAYGAVVDAAQALLTTGELDEGWPYLDRELASRAFTRTG
jgi:2-methylisocitrate lyase-like PEP mutase family enzyme